MQKEVFTMMMRRETMLTASQPAKHNCALFYVKSKSAYFSRRIASIFRMDVVRFFLV